MFKILRERLKTHKNLTHIKKRGFPYIDYFTIWKTRIMECEVQLLICFPQTRHMRVFSSKEIFFWKSTILSTKFRKMNKENAQNFHTVGGGLGDFWMYGMIHYLQKNIPSKIWLMKSESIICKRNSDPKFGLLNPSYVKWDPWNPADAVLLARYLFGVEAVLSNHFHPQLGQLQSQLGPLYPQLQQL